MSPGTYLRLCRERASLSLRELAFLFADPPAVTAEAAQAMLGDAEEGTVALGDDSLARLRLFLSFDRDIYAALVAGVPSPAVCQGCGCSYWDPCKDRSGGLCSWADVTGTICTRCNQAAAA